MQKSASFDEIVKTYPNYLPFKSAGNVQQTNNNRAVKVGYDALSFISVAKNVMTVGAVNGDSEMSNFSCWGPTDDGRIKPDIVTKGVAVTSAYATSDNAYNEIQGTSMAAPAAAALGLLLQQHHNTARGAYLEAAGVKGLMLHTASDLGRPGPDYQFGWGLANGETAAQVISAANADLTANSSTTKIAKITTNPALGASVTYTLKAKGGSTPLSASICWTDDAAPEQDITTADLETSHLVYNFDIKLVDQVTMTEHFPWKGLGMSNRTGNATRTGLNDVDNFKRVDIDAPTASRNYQLVITKRATSPADARQFTIVWTGLEGVALPVELLSFSGKNTEGGNQLTWTTASEVNNKGFQVERLMDNGQWAILGFKIANNKASTYQFMDNAPLATSYYRLRQIDNDGTETFSKIITIERTNKGKGLKVSPNPVSNILTVETTEGADFQVINLLGQQVLTGKTGQRLDVSALRQGTYMLKIGSEVAKFVKQ